MPLFKKPDPVEKAREWKRELQKEMRSLEREVYSIEREEKKVKLQIKQAAKQNDTTTAKMLARELVRSRKAKERIYKSRAELHSVQMALQQNIATIKVAGAMQRSAEIMAGMNNLIKLPQLHSTMMKLGMEMQKAGLIEEIISDTLDMDDDEVEDEANEEVDKVLLEISSEVMAGATAVSRKEPQRFEEEPVEEGESSYAESTKADDDLLARVSAL